MNLRPLAAAAVIMSAGLLVALKGTHRRPVQAAVTARQTSPTVVLVADFREAGGDCGCGRIIERVREAKARGVAVHEIAPDDSAATRYDVKVAPTVLFLGPDGRVVARREGESRETLAAISADLGRLEKGSH